MCATGNGPKTLGPRAPLSGLLKGSYMFCFFKCKYYVCTSMMVRHIQKRNLNHYLAGYDADVITVSGDPLSDIGVLMQPTLIHNVWIAGVRKKLNGALVLLE